MQMNRDRARIHRHVWLLATVLALLASMAASADVHKLSGTMPDFGDVKDFIVSPDGQYVVFRADLGTDEAVELYSVLTTGDALTRLSGLLPSGSSVLDDYQISSDGSRVVYRAPQDVAGVHELYSVPIEGPSSAVVKLNDTLPISGEVLQFLISPDGSRVVYLADQAYDSVIELYSVPIGGPASAGIKLNDLLVAEGDVEAGFVVSPDGARVVYNADQQTNDVYELYSVPIEGPASSGIKLNTALVAEGDIFPDPAISPDSTRVIYRGDQQADDVVELFSVPIVGPASDGVKLNGVLVSGGDVGSGFLIDCDSSRVVYGADQQSDEVIEIYSVPLTGPASAGVKLNGMLDLEGDVMSGFAISPDGSQVVYRADQEANDTFELYSVPIEGPASDGVKLNLEMVAGGNVISGFLISPDGSRVVYRADQDVDGVFELHSVPTLGPASAGVKLNPPLVDGGNVRPGFLIPAGSDRVVYRADQRYDTVTELHSVPIGGPAWTGVRLNEPLAYGGSVQAQIAINPAGSLAVYRADQDTASIFELYAADVQTLVGFWTSSVLVSEDQGSLLLSVRLLNASATTAVTVEYAVTGGTATGGGVDYSLDDGLLTFDAGEFEQTIEVTIVDDGLDEPTETVLLTLTNPQNAVFGANQSSQILIADETYARYLPRAAK